jgi:hypothetical protein
LAFAFSRATSASRRAGGKFLGCGARLAHCRIAHLFGVELRLQLGPACLPRPPGGPIRAAAAAAPRVGLHARDFCRDVPGGDSLGDGGTLDLRPL